MQGSANLNVMIKAARKAGRLLVKDFREVENLQGTSAAASDFTARSMIAAEAALREELSLARDNYGWLSPQAGDVPGNDPTRRWIVDPLNGRINFMHGQPCWAVCIALEHKGAITAAVIYDAAKDEMFHAEKGTGAWLNDKNRLRASNRRRLSDSLVATRIPAIGHKTLPASIRDLARIMPEIAGLRQSDAPALDLAALAAGRLDAFYARELDIWDMVAGDLIAREAGALTGALREDQILYESGSILAASNDLFATFARLMRAPAE